MHYGQLKSKRLRDKKQKSIAAQTTHVPIGLGGAMPTTINDCIARRTNIG